MPFDSASQELCDLLVTRLGGKSGAGEGNRTLVASLEGWSFTTQATPAKRGGIMGNRACVVNSALIIFSLHE